MKKRLIHTSRRRAVLVLTVLLIFLFTSCSEIVLPSAKPVTVTINEFMQQQENKPSAEQTLVALPAIMGIPKAVSGDVIITEEATASIPITRVYNLTSGNLLRVIDDGCPVGFVSDHLDNPQNAEGIFYVNHFNILYICNADGKEVISTYHDVDHPTDHTSDFFMPDAPIFTDSLNGFAYNGVEYFVRDGAVVYEEARPLESDYFNASVLYKDLFYFVSDALVFVFDEEGTLLYEYVLPSYAENAHAFVLQSGDIFIQYTYTVIEDEEYDFVLGDEKHKIVSILASPSKKTETLPLLSFLVTDLHNDFTDEDFYKIYTEKVPNMARVLHIKNKRIDANEPLQDTVLSNALLELFSLFDVVTGALDITRISQDRYLVTTSAGGILLAGDGTKIGPLNNYRSITEKFILTSGAIYDHDLNLVFDLIEEEYTYYASVGQNMILSKVEEKEVSLYLYAGGEPIFLAGASNFHPCYEGYLVQTEAGYAYYDENGKHLCTVAGEIVWIYENKEKDCNTCVGYLVDENGAVTYYRLQFTTIPTVE